jgi:hypothetical protein
LDKQVNDLILLLYIIFLKKFCCYYITPQPTWSHVICTLDGIHTQIFHSTRDINLDLLHWPCARVGCCLEVGRLPHSCNKISINSSPNCTVSVPCSDLWLAWTEIHWHELIHKSIEFLTAAWHDLLHYAI